MALEPGSTAQRTGVPVTLVRDTYSNITAYAHNDGELLAATDSGAMFLYKNSSLVRLTDLHYDSVFPASSTPGQIWFTPDKARYYLTSNTCVEWSLGSGGSGLPLVEALPAAAADYDKKAVYVVPDAKAYTCTHFDRYVSSVSISGYVPSDYSGLPQAQLEDFFRSLAISDVDFGSGTYHVLPIISKTNNIIIGFLEWDDAYYYGIIAEIPISYAGNRYTLYSSMLSAASTSISDVLTAFYAAGWSFGMDDETIDPFWSNDNTYRWYSDGDYVIPVTIGNGALTLQLNGTTVQTFTANQSTNATANIQATPSRTTVALSGSTPSVAAAANTDYTAGTLTSLTMTSVEISALEITFDFTVSSTGCTIDMPWQINADMVDLPEADQRYILSIRGGIAVGTNVAAPGTITATTPVAITGTAGSAITDVILVATASNGKGVVYSIDTLPAGIRFNSGGRFSGTPTTSGNSTSIVTATASGCQPVTITVNFTIS